MQICKRFLFVFIFSFFSLSGIFCQMEMPSVSMPGISSYDGPAMPKVSAPTLGSKFYTPGNVKTNISNKKTSENVSNTGTVQNSGTNENTLEKLKEVFNTSNTSNRLTASDVATLGSDGLFGGIYGLLGSDVTTVSNTYASNNSNDILLKTIMSQLEELKAETKENTEAVRKANLPITKTSSSKVHEFNPAILRFYVNGYNIQDTIRTVYFSKKENDGSFLLTGDRKYSSEGKNREETFYLLFKADGNCGTSAGYFVEPEVVQDYKNEYSFLYQLSEKPKLKAVKTGNLVSVRYVSNDWNMDLLLDIGDD